MELPAATRGALPVLCASSHDAPRRGTTAHGNQVSGGSSVSNYKLTVRIISSDTMRRIRGYLLGIPTIQSLMFVDNEGNIHTMPACSKKRKRVRHEQQTCADCRNGLRNTLRNLAIAYGLMTARPPVGTFWCRHPVSSSAGDTYAEAWCADCPCSTNSSPRYHPPRT